MTALCLLIDCFFLSANDLLENTFPVPSIIHAKTQNESQLKKL